MAEYPYTTVPGRIKSLLLKMREVGIPTKATQQWLKSIGFKSSNDRSLLTILRFIGYIDSSQTPTETWRKYRGGQHGQVLFSVYPDAHARSASEITHVVSTSSSAGKQVISKTVRTFQNLCAEADFSATGRVSATPASPAGEPTISPPATTGQMGVAGAAAPSLHIDIQVHISPDAKPEQIDKIFESMSKHIYKQKK
jgi:hypothetical protein